MASGPRLLARLTVGAAQDMQIIIKVNCGMGKTYRMGTSLPRDRGVLSQGDGSVDGGLGATKYEYTANTNDVGDSELSGDSGGMGYNRPDYGIWRMKTTEYLPNGDESWGTNNREITYTNEVGEPLMQMFVQVDPSTVVYTQGISVETQYPFTVTSHWVYRPGTTFIKVT